MTETLRAWLGNAPDYDPAYLVRDHKRHETTRKEHDNLSVDDPLLHILEFEPAVQALTATSMGIQGGSDEDWPASFPHDRTHTRIYIDGRWEGVKPWIRDATTIGRFIPPRGHLDVLRRDCYHFSPVGNYMHQQAGSVYAENDQIYVVWVAVAHWELRD